MSLSLRLGITWRLLIALLLIAPVLVVACADRGPPSSDELNDLSGPAVHDLIMDQHDDSDQGICGMARISDIEAIGVVPHGLDSASEVPAEVVALIEFSGARLEDYEQRHFDTHRLLLISWDATSRDLGEGYGAELGSVYELHYLEDETSIGWGDVYWGNVHECRPEDLVE